MKSFQIFLLIIYSCSLSGCAEKQNSNTATTNFFDTAATVTTTKDSFATGEIIEHINCRNDAAQSYALYTPAGKNDAVIYFFDPHADGSFPLKKYKVLADAFHFVLIGSNNSKNGNDWQTTENICQTLFADTKARLLFNQNRMYVCGFSGGAKVAGYVALHHNEIKSVILNGAGLPDETPAGNFNFSITAVTGKGDMNMTDLVALDKALDNTSTKHRIIFFSGKHEWAPLNTMRIAFTGLQFDAMRNNNIQKNDSTINVYIQQSKQRLNDDVQIKKFIQAEQECRLAINMLDGITNTNWFREKDNSILNDEAYKQQLQQQQTLFSIEQNKKLQFNVQFQQSDMSYWYKTIAELKTKSKASTAEGAMNERLLAYLSLAFYSISNQLINNNQNSNAQYFIALYKVVDPSNSEAWYFSAIINARNKNAKATQNDLMKAAENGFIDTVRMRQQPEFKSLQSQINLNIVEAKMKTLHD